MFPWQQVVLEENSKQNTKTGLLLLLLPCVKPTLNIGNFLFSLGNERTKQKKARLLPGQM